MSIVKRGTHNKKHHEPYSQSKPHPDCNRAGVGGKFAQLIFGDWQVYEGEPVVLAWNTQGLSNVTVEANHRQSKAKLHAWGWTAQGVGEHLAKLYSEQGVVTKPLWVLPQPKNARVWIDAEPKVVKPNEHFLVAWNATGGVPKVSATSYGVFTNATEGSQIFARSIPGTYTFRIQIGKTEAEVKVRVEGNLPELTSKVQMQP